MISVNNLTKTYKTGSLAVEILKGINLNVEKGEYIAIMGPSGSGKSTLLNILGCLDRHTDGNFSLDGINIENMSEDDLSTVRCQKIGFVFQAYNLLPKLTAIENVEMPAMYNGDSKKLEIKKQKNY